jgi:hypothetical protein
MAYVGFDLDETLGHFSSLHYHIYYLYFHKSHYQSGGRGPEPELSNDLRNRFETALNLFVEKLAGPEAAGLLGFLRPSILQIAQRLWILKQIGKVKGVLLYSNNGNLGMLHFAAKLIERIAGTPGLFCDFIHLYHPMRHGSSIKSTSILREAFRNGPCSRAGEVPENFVENLYFFDDIPHSSIVEDIGERYFLVPPYVYDPPAFDFLNQSFKEAFLEAGLEAPDYYEYGAGVFGNNKTVTVEKILKSIRNDQSRYELQDNRGDDSTFIAKFNALFPMGGGGRQRRGSTRRRGGKQQKKTRRYRK